MANDGEKEWRKVKAERRVRRASSFDVMVLYIFVYRVPASGFTDLFGGNARKGFYIEEACSAGELTEVDKENKVSSV